MGRARTIIGTALALALSLTGVVRGQDTVADGAPDAPAPRRVVTMNLCADQLAMLLAAPGQLISVSYLAADPRSSAMAQEAESYPLNHGRAEEVWLMRPDLVIVGAFSNRATVDMLRRLGVPVIEMQPAYGLGDIPNRLREMGDALGRGDAAEAAVAVYETQLATLRDEVARRPRAALYYANGYTSGDRTLAGEIITAAGFLNIATEAGVPHGGHLPLEMLAMARPEAVISERPYPGASRSEEILDHPVVKALRNTAVGAVLTDRDWICGTPDVLRAIEGMRNTRRRMVFE